MLDGETKGDFQKRQRHGLKLSWFDDVHGMSGVRLLWLELPDSRLQGTGNDGGLPRGWVID